MLCPRTGTRTQERIHIPDSVDSFHPAGRLSVIPVLDSLKRLARPVYRRFGAGPEDSIVRSDTCGSNGRTDSSEQAAGRIRQIRDARMAQQASGRAVLVPEMRTHRRSGHNGLQFTQQFIQPHQRGRTGQVNTLPSFERHSLYGIPLP